MTVELHNQSCFEFFEKTEHKNIDCVIVDLPYGQTVNSWDIKIDLQKMWAELKKICKSNAMYIFFCTTKFGNELINSNPSYFRYDLVWEKTNSVGHLSVKKIPMRTHEMIYIFSNKADDIDNEFNSDLREYSKKLFTDIKISKNVLFKKCGNSGLDHFTRQGSSQFGIPTKKNYQFLIDEYKIDKFDYFISHADLKKKWVIHNENTYNPQMTKCKEFIYKKKKEILKTNYGAIQIKETNEKRNSKYPVSILKYKNDKEKLHPTQKPVGLLEWLVKTYSNENETILDFTMGSGSTGVACVNSNRRFIGVEMDEIIFKIAEKRLKNFNK
jgi:DNA modification methylase